MYVAPHAGAWIETRRGRRLSRTGCVAPHAGAWIETVFVAHETLRREVAPHAGAWIETLAYYLLVSRWDGRAPCGRVD